MPNTIAAVAAFAVKVFTGTVFAGTGTLATIGNALAQVAALATLDAGLRKLTQKELSQDPDNRRDILIRSAVSPKAKIYGKALVGGLLAYMNTSGTNNRDLHVLISLAGTECDDVTDIWFDETKIPSANINWGSDGKVTSGKFANYAWCYKKLGASGQTVFAHLNSAFTDITTAHKGQGNCLLAVKFRYQEESAAMYEAGPPQNIRALVSGAKIYDPRLDTTVEGGSGSHRVADPSTWEWSENPALCVADALIDTEIGPGFAPTEIDYVSLIAEADHCDTVVSISGGTEKRYTTNGVIYSTTKWRENISKLLSAMNGRFSHTGGKFRIRAGRYVAPTVTIDESWLRGDLAVRTATPKSDRFNAIKASIFDPDADYKNVQTARVTGASYLSRDKNKPLLREITLPMTNSNQMAQRLCFKQLYQTNQQKVVTAPCNFKALQIEMHEHINVTIAERNWSAKKFRCIGWEYLDMEGINLVFEEDSESAYDDPDVADYTTNAYGGLITFGAPGVPAPSGMTATAKEGGILWQWTNPTPASMWENVELYTSANSSWGSASKIAEGVGDYFLQVLQSGETRYGWIRATTDVDESIRNPDNDTSTITATALAKLNDIADNATAGATWNGDIVDQPADGNILNSVLAITAAGALSGGGASGTVTIVGLGFNGSLDATDNTITSSASDPTGGINGSLHHNTTSNSWWAKIAGAWYKVGDETANNIAASIAGQGDLAIVDSADWATQVSGAGKPDNDAEVNTINSGDGLNALDSGQDTKLNGIATGATVGVMGSIGMKLDYISFSSANAGECYLHGYNQAGVAADITPVVWLDGERHTLLGLAAENQNIFTQLINKIGWIIYDAGDTTPFTIFSVGRNVAFAYQEDDGTWKYDNNGAGITFTVTSNIYAIGHLELGSPAETILSGGVWGFAIPLANAPNFAATFGSNWSVDLSNIPTNLDALAGGEDIENSLIVLSPGTLDAQWIWDGTNKSPNVAYQDVPIEFTDVDGATVGGTTTIRITWQDADYLTGAETGSNANTTVATIAGGGDGDGYVIVEVTHTASGVTATVYSSILTTGGSGGK